MAGRLMATGWLFGSRELPQGYAMAIINFLPPTVHNRSASTASTQPRAGPPKAPGR